jgi:hypothetical protein
MPSIIIDRIGCEEPAHEFGKMGNMCTLQKEVKMGLHHAPGMNPVFKEMGIAVKVFEKFILIPFALKDRVLGIGSREHIIKRKGEIYSLRSSHSRSSSIIQ